MTAVGGETLEMFEVILLEISKESAKQTWFKLVCNGRKDILLVKRKTGKVIVNTEYR